MTTIPFKQMPTYMLRDGSAIPGGVEGYVFLLLVNRMVTKAGSYRYKGLSVPLLENQVCCTLQDIANVTGYTVKRVRTAVKNLQEKSILVKAEGKATKSNLSIYTIDFSHFEKPEWQSSGQSKGKARAKQGQTELKTIETAQTETPVGGGPSASPDRVLDMDAKLFEEGRRILGKSAGGMIAKLKKAIGPGKTYELLMAAEKKSDPASYVAAAMRAATAKIEDVPIGQVIPNGRRDGRGSAARSVAPKNETEEEKQARVEAKMREVEAYYAELGQARQVAR